MKNGFELCVEIDKLTFDGERTLPGLEFRLRWTGLSVASFEPQRPPPRAFLKSKAYPLQAAVALPFNSSYAELIEQLQQFPVRLELWASRGGKKSFNCGFSVSLRGLEALLGDADARLRKPFALFDAKEKRVGNAGIAVGLKAVRQWGGERAEPRGIWANVQLVDRLRAKEEPSKQPQILTLSGKGESARPFTSPSPSPAATISFFRPFASPPAPPLRLSAAFALKTAMQAATSPVPKSRYDKGCDPRTPSPQPTMQAQTPRTACFLCGASLQIGQARKHVQFCPQRRRPAPSRRPSTSSIEEEAGLLLGDTSSCSLPEEFE